MIYTPLKKRKKIRSFPFHKKCHERKESYSFFTLFLFFDFSFHRNPVGKRGRNFVRMEIAEVVAILVPSRREKNRKKGKIERPKDEERGGRAAARPCKFHFCPRILFRPCCFPNHCASTRPVFAQRSTALHPFHTANFPLDLSPISQSPRIPAHHLATRPLVQLVFRVPLHSRVLEILISRFSLDLAKSNVP